MENVSIASGDKNRLTFYYGTEVTVTLIGQDVALLPAGVYSFAVKSHRDVDATNLALSTVAIQAGTSSISAVMNFGTESALAFTKSGKSGAWLEISNSDTVLYQRMCLLVPRVYDGSTPAPTPVTIYYTKAEVDALIASLEVGITSVNGQTGAVVLDAADVGAVASSGRTIEAVTASGGTVTLALTDAKCYTYTVTDGDLIAVDAPASGRMPVTWLLLAVPAGDPAFTFDPSPWWADENGKFAAENPAPTFDAGVYLLTFATLGGHFCASKAAEVAL